MADNDKPEVDVTPDKDGGILKQILTEGHGYERPSAGNEVEVHYTGRLVDGTVFDSSVTRGERFKFKLGEGSVIKGWDVGVATMRRGEKAVFTLKPEYGYGATGSPPTIPANATLVFEIELFDWRMEDLTKKKDGGVQRTILVEGSDYVTPNEGASVTVRLVGRDGERIFEDREVSFVVGEASEASLIEGIDVAVAKMKKGETSRIRIRKGYAWGDLPPRNFELTPGADVTYDITLISFEKQKEIWEMDEAEKLEQAESAKNRGSEFFRKEKYPLAIKQYKRVTQMLGPYSATDERDPKKDALLLAAHLNLAMTYLKQNKASLAIENCNLALEMDASNVKAYFRRGSANFSLKEYPAALADFQKVLSLEPNNAAARQEIIRTSKAIQDHRQREKKLFSGMFDKFAQHDNEIERRRATNVWKELGDEKKREFQSQENAEAPSE
jgi:FK506-binding protein 4/5